MVGERIRAILGRRSYPRQCVELKQNQLQQLLAHPAPGWFGLGAGLLCRPAKLPEERG